MRHSTAHRAIEMEETALRAKRGRAAAEITAELIEAYLWHLRSAHSPAIADPHLPLRKLRRVHADEHDRCDCSPEPEGPVMKEPGTFPVYAGRSDG